MKNGMIKNLVLGTLRELKRLIDVESYVNDVVISRLHPWMASYVLFDDGQLGCGFSAAIHKGIFLLPNMQDIKRIFQWINETSDAYEVVENFANVKLERMDDQTLTNAVAVSTLNALSYRLLNTETLQSHGYFTEEYSTAGLLFGHRIGMFLNGILNESDKIVIVGFAYWLFPYIVNSRREIKCLELVDNDLFEVYTLSGMKPRIEVSESREETLEKADVILVTGMTIPNETLPMVLKYCKAARQKIVYGPSCSFYPKKLFEFGFDLVLAMKTPANQTTKLNILDGRGLHPYEDPFTKLIAIKITD